MWLVKFLNRPVSDDVSKTLSLQTNSLSLSFSINPSNLRFIAIKTFYIFRPESLQLVY